MGATWERIHTRHTPATQVLRKRIVLVREVVLKSGLAYGMGTCLGSAALVSWLG